MSDALAPLRAPRRMAAVHWHAAVSVLFELSRMTCPDELFVSLLNSSCEHLWCNDALGKDGVEGGLGW
jgi:hypothetical protein